ncbi:MAG: gluconate:H+ symporter [Sediminibacterium sp.]|nr:MAG: Gnt-I system high-affinity gluconate [Chitinophagaceae bacterium]MDP1843707.1 gluconate:H+ symporter [Sediminibacterium sp.]TXT32965.1 MAG: Gnt-I system high-affinity gluconate transporter [Chitinophagaceae bacterium]
MYIAIIIGCLIVLMLLIAWIKLHPFLAFILVALLAGWWLGLPVNLLMVSIKTGIGGLMGDLLLTIGLGAMLGKLIAETGAAQQIAQSLIQLFGEKHLQWAMMLTGFVVGIPLFYNVGFILLVPLVFSITYNSKLPIVYTAIPMLAALSVTHGFLPPHPSPLAISAQLNANTGTVLLYGLLIAIPTVIIAGPLFATTLKKMEAKPLSIFEPKQIATELLPGKFNSFFSALLPAILMIVFALFQFNEVSTGTMLKFWSDPSIVLLLSLTFATISLGIANKYSVKSIMQFFSDAIQEIAPILLIIAGAGALKQVLTDSGISKQIAQSIEHIAIHPLILGWLIAAIIRVCIGSATVAALTAAGIMAPVLLSIPFNPNLMVLAIGAGSLMFSHINDSGFWMFKSYFNLSIKDTLKSWSVMETIVSIIGLLGVLALNSLL